MEDRVFPRTGRSHAFRLMPPPSQCPAQWIHRQEERGNHPVGLVFPPVGGVLGEMAFHILVALAPSDEATRILKATCAFLLLPQLHKEIGVQQTVATLVGERAPAAAVHSRLLQSKMNRPKNLRPSPRRSTKPNSAPKNSDCSHWEDLSPLWKDLFHLWKDPSPLWKDLFDLIIPFARDAEAN